MRVLLFLLRSPKTIAHPRGRFPIETVDKTQIGIEQYLARRGAKLASDMRCAVQDSPEEQLVRAVRLQSQVQVGWKDFSEL